MKNGKENLKRIFNVAFALLLILSCTETMGQGSNGYLAGNTGNYANSDFNSMLGKLLITTNAHYSLAGGLSSEITSGYYSMAFGYQAIAKGNASFALGYRSKSLGNYSLAAGYYSNVANSKSYAFSFGRYTLANANKCFVFGTGSGISEEQYLTNSVENSFLIGFDNEKLLMVKKRGFLGAGQQYGLVGINTDTPQYELDVVGTANVEQFRLPTNATSGFVLVSDADGLATWQDKAGKWSENSYGINYSGNVGLGVNNPSAKLDIAGYIRSQKLWLTGTETSVYYPNGEALNFTTYDDAGDATTPPPATSNPITRMTLTNDGELGIGTETPSEMLDVNGNGHFEGNVGIGVTEPEAKLHVDGAIRSGSTLELNNGKICYGSNLDFYNGLLLTGGGSGGDNSEDLFETKMTLTVDGKLGIGTDTPSEMLDVNGNASIAQNLILPSGKIYFDDDATSFAIDGQDNSALGGDPFFYVTGQGKTGIGTSSPTEKLDVNGTTKTTNLKITGLNANVNDVLVVDQDGVVSATPNTIFGDDLGDHTATKNIKLNGKWLSGDGGDEGIFVSSDGNVGIGTRNLADGYHLSVDGNIIAEEVYIRNSQLWPDYVFEEDYKLQSLEEVKTYIADNKHLPGVLSASDIEENGMPVAEMNAVLLEKVEELTLYLIQLNETNKRLEERVSELEKK